MAVGCIEPVIVTAVIQEARPDRERERVEGPGRNPVQLCYNIPEQSGVGPLAFMICNTVQVFLNSYSGDYLSSKRRWTGPVTFVCLSKVAVFFC